MKVFLGFYEVEVTNGTVLHQLSLVLGATNNDLHFRIWLKMHHSAQKKISKNLQTCGAHDAMAGTIFDALVLYPHFSDENYAALRVRCTVSVWESLISSSL